MFPMFRQLCLHYLLFHILGRGCWDLASCQLSLNSLQQFQRSRKCLSKSKARAAIYCIQIGMKNTILVEDVEILLPFNFRWIPFSGFKGDLENVSADQRLGQPSCFSNRPKNINLVEDVKILLHFNYRWIPFSSLKDVENVSAYQRLGRPSCFFRLAEKQKLGRGH